MRRTMLVALIGLTTACSAFAQRSASLSFSGPTTWTPGTSITLQCNDTFNIGGSYGVSYWLEVNNALAPFLTITSLTYHQPFTFGNNTGTFPFSFNTTFGADAGYMTTTTANGLSGDLGAESEVGVVVPDGTYPDITDITFSLAANAPIGTFTLRTTTALGSVQITTDIHDYLLPQASFVFNVVPEPSTLALIALTALSAGVIAYQRRK